MLPQTQGARKWREGTVPLSPIAKLRSCRAASLASFVREFKCLQTDSGVSLTQSDVGLAPLVLLHSFFVAPSRRRVQ